MCLKVNIKESLFNFLLIKEIFHFQIEKYPRRGISLHSFHRPLTSSKIKSEHQTKTNNIFYKMCCENKKKYVNFLITQSITVPG